MRIEGDLFDPPGYRMSLAKLLGYGKLLLILCVVSNFNIFTIFGFQNVPGWYQWCTTNKVYACLMIFFVSNAIETQLISTGAFEIIFNGMPVWSKLETGRIPQPPELFGIIDAHLKMK